MLSGSKKGKKTTTKKSVGKEPASMDELLARYGSSVKTFSRGDIVTAKVLEITPNSLVLDIGGKSEGLVAEKAFDEAKSFINTLEIGQQITGKVIVSETPDGFTIISLRNAASKASMDKLEDAMKNAKVLRTLVRAVNPSGAVVDVMGSSGFIPRSQLGKEAAKNTEKLVGETVDAVVIDIIQESNRIVLSEKAVSEKEELDLIKKAMKNIKQGDTFQGKVTTVSNFGAFVEVKAPLEAKKKGKSVPVEGLVHISELSWGKVDQASDVVEVGDKVEVSVISVSLPDVRHSFGKLALSMRDAKKDPWDEVKENYKVESKVNGKVVKISDFGVFIELEPGIEGLIHITKIPPDRKLNMGDAVDVFVEEIDDKEKKISLGLVLTAKPVGYK